ncbi:MAG: 30S ribosomal protein S12 methylthiotransferase RimO [Bacteroidales bacterium]|nr:30S ribosomal protein S12 methylthiotransferase RimO [Bacteroidales bacterium]
MKPRKIKLITLGCSKNRVDSEHLLRQILANDIEISPENEPLEKAAADTVIINTCGFIKDAKEESIQAILEAAEAKRIGYTSRVLVFGCLSQRYRQELIQSIPEVDGFFGAFDTQQVLEALGSSWDKKYSNQRFLTTPAHYAYLKISEGCDRICSYCSIPLIRGKHISVPQENLVAEAEFLAQKGVKELILVAQDTTYYGVDLYGRRNVAELIDRLSDVKGIEWIRLLYAYPAAFPDDLLDVMANNPKVCKYLDIPLQHISDKVLAKMRRSVDGEQTRRLVEKFRNRVPGITLRTTMIVGHPGEDKRAFEELMTFVSEARFERLGAFTYSEEEGTWGAQNLKDTIRKREKEERYGRLMELQSKISLEYNEARVGTQQRVLIDSETDKYLVARSRSESPEVDGEILIDTSEMTKDYQSKNIIGTFVDVEITGAEEYDLHARMKNN